MALELSTTMDSLMVSAEPFQVLRSRSECMQSDSVKSLPRSRSVDISVTSSDPLPPLDSPQVPPEAPEPLVAPEPTIAASSVVPEVQAVQAEVQPEVVAELSAIAPLEKCQLCDSDSSPLLPVGTPSYVEQWAKNLLCEHKVHAFLFLYINLRLVIPFPYPSPFDLLEV
jgi:hypothetical protein